MQPKHDDAFPNLQLVPPSKDTAATAAGLPTAGPETIILDGSAGLTATPASYPALTVVMFIEGTETDVC